MRKKELLHLHSLLRTLKQELEIKHGVPEEVFEEYESLSIRPEQIYKRKDQHETAVLTLSQSISEQLAGETSYNPDGEPRNPAPARN